KVGNDLDKPSEYIRVTDCTSVGSKGGFVAGSENASGLRESLFQNLYVADIMLSHSIWLKTYWSRGGLTENIIFRDIDSTKRIDIAANYATSENNPADELPIYRYLTFENCTPSFVFEGLEASGGREATYVQNVTLRGCPNSGDISYGKNFEIWDSYESRWDLSNTENIVFKYSNQDSSTDIKVKDGAQYVSAVNLEKKTITATLGATAEQILADIESLIPDTNLVYELNSDATLLTVTSQNGENTVNYSISYAYVWDFAKYTTEVSTTESGFTESYDGLVIAIANNGADSDHDKITTNGVYWRGGASSGDTTRYIEYTPTVDGTLVATGKMNSGSGRWGISTSKTVSSLVADESSSTSTSTSTIQLKCSAGTTYYIFPKSKSATVTSVSYIPE
ncbi:MAG: hypothetical protein IJX57_06335, partial [Clostridia bacterium]|nr:hypothetical protein [Clostridia bacterium]